MNYAYLTLLLSGVRGGWLELLAQLALGIFGAVLALRDGLARTWGPGLHLRAGKACCEGPTNFRLPLT